MAGFDPASWLAHFNQVGGYVDAGAEGSLSAGWHLHGFTPAQNQAACAAVAEIKGDHVRLAAVSAFVVDSLARPVCGNA